MHRINSGSLQDRQASTAAHVVCKFENKKLTVQTSHERRLNQANASILLET